VRWRTRRGDVPIRLGARQDRVSGADVEGVAVARWGAPTRVPTLPTSTVCVLLCATADSRIEQLPIDSNTAKVRHDADYADMGVSSQSCWALSRLDKDGIQCRALRPFA